MSEEFLTADFTCRKKLTHNDQLTDKSLPHTSILVAYHTFERNNCMNTLQDSVRRRHAGSVRRTDVNTFEHSWGDNSSHTGIKEKEHPEPTTSDNLSGPTSESCECSDWLQNLASSYGSSARAEHQYFEDKHNQEVMFVWVSKMFAQVRKYADEFNLRLSSDHLVVEYSEPGLHRVECPDRNDSFDAERFYFEGHFTTRRRALLLRGIGDEIDIFDVPADVWLGLSLNTIDEVDYPPFVKMHLTGGEGVMVTITTGGANNKTKNQLQIDTSSIPLLARLLFSQLIESSV